MGKGKAFKAQADRIGYRMTQLSEKDFKKNPERWVLRYEVLANLFLSSCRNNEEVGHAVEMIEKIEEEFEEVINSGFDGHARLIAANRISMMEEEAFRDGN